MKDLVCGHCARRLVVPDWFPGRFCDRTCYDNARAAASETGLRARFEAKIKVDATTGCWNWLGAKLPSGHGQFGVRMGRVSLAHRVSYEMNVGPIASGMLVCHRCDNPPCVNPAHLFAGTQLENMADCKAKGRTARGERLSARRRGERNAKAKLDDSAVIAIRQERRSGSSLAMIARRFGVTRQNVGFIVRGDTWGHVREVDA